LLALLAAPAAWSVYTTTQGGGGMTPAAGPSAGGFGGGSGGGFGGDLSGANSGLLTYLERHQGSTKYLVAVQNSNSAASYVIETGKPVMSLGGFGGSDPILTLSELQQQVKDNVVRYFLGVGGFGGGSSGIGQWVQSACSAVPSSDYGGSTSQAAGVAGGNPGSGPAGPGQSAQPGQSPSAAPGGFGGGAGGLGGRGGGFGGFGSGSQLYDCAHAVP